LASWRRGSETHETTTNRRIPAMGRLIPLGFRPVWLSRPIAPNENRLTPLTREAPVKLEA
jgi:hypothetical protein